MIYRKKLIEVALPLEAIKDGLKSRDFFGYATGVSDDGRYQGLMFGSLTGTIYIDESSVLVKPEAAQRQLEADSARAASSPSSPVAISSGQAIRNGVESPAVPPSLPTELPQAAKVARRYHGSVVLDRVRVARDAGRIAEEVIQHLVATLGADVEITMEIQAWFPGGMPDQVVRTVTENARTLKFKSSGFEEE